MRPRHLALATAFALCAPFAVSTGVSAATAHDAGSYIVTLAGGVDPFAVMLDHGIKTDSFTSFLPLLDSFAGHLSSQEADSLGADARVVRFERDQILTTEAVVS